MKTYAALFLLTIAFAVTSYADTTWVAAGNVSGVWTADDSPYMLQGDVHVTVLDALEIQEGTRVVATGHFAIYVAGSLHALGVPENLILFTCDTTRTSYWSGLHFGATPDVQEMQFCTFEFIGGNASAVICDGCLVAVESCTIRESYSQAAAAYVSAAGIVAFNDCHIHNNGQGGCGSVVNAREGSLITLTYCRIHDNQALDGGAFCLYDSELILRDCEISYNTGGIWGGVIYADGESTVDAKHCIFQGNRAMTGGVYFGWENDVDSRIFFRKCQFIENSVSATIQTAASVLNPASVMEIEGCTFVGNGPGDAGAVRASGNCTITNSIFAYQQGQEAIYASTAQLQISHCDFFGNAEGDVNGITPNFFGVVDTFNANNDPSDRFFNIFLAPAFVDTVNDDYALTAESPCIDAGDPASTLDPDGTVADLGALFFDQTNELRDETQPAVQRYALGQNFPNPFNAVTQIQFLLPRAADVQIKLFDITGRLVSTFLTGHFAAGMQTVSFAANDLPSGVYIYRLHAGDFVEARKLVVLK